MSSRSPSKSVLDEPLGWRPGGRNARLNCFASQGAMRGRIWIWNWIYSLASVGRMASMDNTHKKSYKNKTHNQQELQMGGGGG